MNLHVATHGGRIAALVGLVLTASVRADGPTTWSVPARVFPASSETTKPAQPPMPRPPARPATSSNPLPPAYQTSVAARWGTQTQPSDATIRFVIPLVERPLLVETKIMIDGKPFRMLREERI